MVDAVVGIDVGGARKGFHAVALTAGTYAGQLATGDASELVHWCRSVVHARVIAIDAPCRWSTDGRPRACERELMRQGIFCFASPTREKAVDHPTHYFGWMLQGEALYRELEGGTPQEAYPLLRSLPPSGRGCFETFPHAITWHLRGGQAQAAQKRVQRRELLVQAGIDLAPLTNIDLIDAALCALTAHRVDRGAIRRTGSCAACSSSPPRGLGSRTTDGCSSTIASRWRPARRRGSLRDGPPQSARLWSWSSSLISPPGGSRLGRA